MKAMILAAGRGERMRPLTDRCPKPLLSAGGKPLIVHHIERLRAAGIQELVINTAWLGEQFPAALGDGRAFGVNIQYSHEGTALETAGGIRRALPLLGEGDFLLVNGDVYCDCDFEAVAAAKAPSLLLVDNPPQHPGGDFGLVGGLVANEPRQYTYAGIAKLDSRLFVALPEGHGALGPLLRRWADEGRLGGLYHGGYWQDVGTPERLEALDAFLKERR
ncbi:nucleotidyltransferase family protein [Gallaecimonas kandeliae]|uniref:N-acetylmuramate alpha-1-phosphate uridylyltransferase MurU n=1 Tax=Gallaecimonas kandeliae TaxID=3029055 RepID=UPI00264965F1|nr:nucleotidyltransferase family protein [Gallaecimonas kandeliae]WKE66144.1 nucleotidyltransferase family protein [Gallaecimonas kandeliae]